MGDSNTDMSDLGAKEEENFGFAFDDTDHSDRVLHIEIIQAPHSNDSIGCVEVKISLQISSRILAAKSLFFNKLFTNGMIESHQRDVTLRIKSSEEAALMDVLNFIYNNTLSATTGSDLLDVLMDADKFQVTSCIRFCFELLLKMPMSLESALLYLELPSSVLVAEAVQPLIDATKQYLVARYRDFNKSQEEAMELPLSALEIVLGSEGLQVDSEDDVFNFILKWGREHYGELKERREILTKCLARFICFPYMSCSELKEVLVCADFDHEEVSKLVVEALFFKDEVPYGQHIHASKDLTPTKSSVSGRVYNQRLVKVVHLEYPWPRCVIYFDLKKEECGNLFPSEVLLSESFLLGGRWFYLVAQCGKEQQCSSQHFGLFVHMIGCCSETCTIDFDFAVMKKPLKEFESQSKDKNCILTENEGWGCWDLFGIPWTTFMSDESEYFIDGILHL